MTGSLHTFHNGEAFPLADVPFLATDDFMQKLIDAVDGGWRVSSYFGAPAGETVALYAILAYKKKGLLGIMATTVNGEAFPSLTPIIPQLHLFEREIAEETGLLPDGHPGLKPVRFHRSFRPGHDAWGRAPGEPILPGVMEFYRVEGEEVHEVAVGPVHAGIIEPGHFRFQCHGEEVFNLEISLGYQHRGIEAGLAGGPHPRTLYRMETLAGDTTVGHSQAYCIVLEALGGMPVPARAEVLRGIALELERLANHTGDLGALAGDVGYLPTASYCGRIRGDFLNMSAVLCGSRFGRGLIRPGGVGFDCSHRQQEDLLARLDAARNDLTSAVDLLWNSPSVMARFEGTGRVDTETGREIGLVGPPARACGLNRDVRRDHPFGIFRMSQIPVVTAPTGDVYARALVRWMEAEKSLEFLAEQLRQLPGKDIRTGLKPPGGGMVAVALTEGWRGEICHVAITDAAGRFARYKVTDPSFHNWTGLSLALRNEQISDFPLCNKSFNLSYCGFDL
ncbi:NADH-quinone oxidoreductase subunit C [Geomobilimonas luticola]|uniref:NADH-quinone oxidoreductase subunit C n=1 Tax=Geomobilimonas luticola TaxID=1114878 RepID=A0ABS5SFG0_9BACT|nr:NADH-quinone oxidoreductase subunit C [Geomobilimonas luticola]MBT0653356.1 NADH-quinone oxidoreductase subunit C [Geomobilimonas luticola]